MRQGVNGLPEIQPSGIEYNFMGWLLANYPGLRLWRAER